MTDSADILAKHLGENTARLAMERFLEDGRQVLLEFPEFRGLGCNRVGSLSEAMIWRFEICSNSGQYQFRGPIPGTVYLSTNSGDSILISRFRIHGRMEISILSLECRTIATTVLFVVTIPTT